MVGWKCEGKRNTVKRKGIQKGRRKGNKERKKGNVATSLKNHSCAASKENVKGYCEGCRVENQPRNYTTHTQQAFSFAPACFTKRELEQKKDDGEREKERERELGVGRVADTPRDTYEIFMEPCTSSPLSLEWIEGGTGRFRVSTHRQSCFREGMQITTRCRCVASRTKSNFR